MSKVILLLICVFSMGLGAAVSFSLNRFRDQSGYSLNHKDNRIELFQVDGAKICMIERDIKGFSDITIYNKSGAVAQIRWMAEGSPSITNAYLKVVSKKNGSEEVQVLNPDYAAD